MAYNALSGDEIRAILQEEAKKQFVEKGIANTQMKDIAAAAKIGRSTLYRYYQQKEQLALAVTFNLINQNVQQAISAAFDEALSGFEQLRRFCDRYIDILKQNVKVLGYLSEFDRIFELEYPDYPESRSFVENINQSVILTSEVIIRGIDDGSIVSKDDPLLLSSVIINTLMGVSQRVLTRSEHILEEHGYSGETIVNKSIELILDSLKAK